METATELKRVFMAQSSGTGGRFEIEIHMNAGRELTSEDNWNIRKAAESIEKSIRAESIRLNPNTQKESKKERADILGLFGDNAIYVEEIPNGYCSDYCCKHLPWLTVTTKKGRITIGWRKRVLNIDWEGSAISQSADALFSDEDVTKGNYYIHAWGLEKAKEYIDVLLNSINDEGK